MPVGTKIFGTLQRLKFQNRKRYGGMRDVAEKPRGQPDYGVRGFQNRKRYGGMRDSVFKIRIKVMFIKAWSFKTVNGMEACVTAAFAEGFTTPRKSHFWKVFRAGRFSIAFSDKTNQMSFRNRS